MKKSMILSICGIVLVFITLHVMGSRKPFYEKREVFNSKNEAIASFLGYMNTYESLENGRGYSNTYPKEFFESISLRYRIYIKNNQFRESFGYIPLILDYSLEEVQDKYIKDRYDKSFHLIGKYKKSEDVTYYKLKGTGLTIDEKVDKTKVKEDGTINLEGIIDVKYREVIDGVEYIIDSNDNNYILEDVNLYLIVVDEGEGYVIDYYEWIN